MSSSIMMGQNWYLAPKMELLWFGRMKLRKKMENFAVAISKICSNMNGGTLGHLNLAPMIQN